MSRLSWPTRTRRRPAGVRRLIPALLLALVIPIAGGLSAGPAAAAAAPATPVVKFVEDFETLDPDVWYQTPRSLAVYTGAEPYRPTYTADPAWLTHCNGTVTGAQQESGYGSSIDANNCVPLAYYNAQQLDMALVYAGAVGDSGGNDSLTARTDQPGREFDPGAGKVQFETESQLPINLSNRFVGFRVLTAAMNCDRSGFVPALLQFRLKSGAQGSTTKTVGDVIDTCAGDEIVRIGPGYMGGRPTSNPVDATIGVRYTSAGVLQSGSTVGLQIINQQASGTGNDVALDEISILDVTPQLSQAFGAQEINLWASTTLTFTVTNTSELGAKSGFSFAETLPSGLQVAPVAQYATTCRSAGSTGAKPQSKVLAFKGGLAEGQQSCTYAFG